MKGLIHFHSKFSYDSHISIDAIIDFAVDQQLDFLILTDHDTIDGSVALRKRVEERGCQLVVPIAAEYCTEFGDIIAAFIQKEINARSLNEFCEEVKSQGGVIMLPHPYDQHPKDKVDLIASRADLIEVFNQRCSYENDRASSLLAEKYDAQTYPGSDAHLKCELPNVISVVALKGELSDTSLKEALCKGGANASKVKKTLVYNVRRSQLVKALKKRSPKIFYRNIRAILISFIRGRHSKRCG